jgi:hypothetical protein
MHIIKKTKKVEQYNLQKRGKHVGVCGFEGWVALKFDF